MYEVKAENKPINNKGYKIFVTQFFPPGNKGRR